MTILTALLLLSPNGALADTANISYELGGVDSCSGIPSQYEQVEYLQSSGSQYIDTGVPIPATNSAVKVRSKINYYNSQASKSAWGIQKSGTMSISPQLWLNASKQLWLYIGGSAAIRQVSYSFGTDYEFEIDANNGNYVFKQNENTYSGTYTQNFPTGANMFLFASNYNGATQYANVKMYYFQYYINDNLAFNGIPVRRKSDQVLGMYDTVSKGFKQNSGSGTFDSGLVVSDTCGPNTYEIGVGTTINGTPTRDGYIFAGWCTDSGLQNCAMTQTIGTNETGDKTFYAKWIDSSTTYNVTYSCGTGTGTITDPDSPYLVGTEVETPVSTCTPPENSIFTGWSCGGNDVVSGGTFTIYDDTTCTAQYSACTPCAATNASCSLSIVNNTCTYTTSCNTGYGNIQNDGAYNASCTANDYTITYNLTGGDDCSEVPSEYEQLEYITATGSQLIDTGVAGVPSTWELRAQTTATNNRFMILLARGTSQQTYFGIPNQTNTWGAGPNTGQYTNVPGTTDATMTVVFESGQISGTVNGQSFVRTGTANLNTNYKLFSYNSDFWYQGKLYYARGTVGDTTINLVPARRKSDGVIGLYDTGDTTGNPFKTNLGSGTFGAGPVTPGTCGANNYTGAPTTYTYGTGATINGTPQREGYAFAGWCTDSELQNCAMSQTIDTNTAENKTFYAKWVLTSDTYNVTYSCGTGTGTMTDSNSPYISGRNVTILNSTCTPPTNYTFNGWLCGGNAVAAGETFAIYDDIECVAQYVGNSYNITYDLTGGDVCYSVPDEYEELEYVGINPGLSLNTYLSGFPSTWELRAQGTVDPNPSVSTDDHYMILLGRGGLRQTSFGITWDNSGNSNQPRYWGSAINTGAHTNVLQSTDATITLNFTENAVNGTVNGEPFSYQDTNSAGGYYKISGYPSENYHQNNEYGFRGKLYYLRGTVGNTTINLIPARRISDSVVGLYDTVGQTFRIPTYVYERTADSFTAGPVTNSSTCGSTNYNNAPTTYTYGTGATINGTPTRDGYIFVGWCTDSELQNCSMSQTISASTTGDKTFYAKWATPYTVTYSCGDGTGNITDSNSPYASGTTVTTLSNTCTPPENSIFTEWSCGGNGVSAGGTFTISDDTTCTAQYSTCTPCAPTNASCSLSVVNNTCTYTTECESGYENIQNNGEYNASCTQIVPEGCTGDYYDDGGTCVRCPDYWRYNTEDGKQSITECQTFCEAGTWVDQPDVSRFGYTRLEYVESTGQQYIDIGERHHALNIRGEIRVGTPINSALSTNVNILGNQLGSNGYSVGWAPSAFKVWVDKNSSSGTGRLNGPTHTMPANTIHELSYEITPTRRYLTYDGVTVDSSHLGGILEGGNIRLFDNGKSQTNQNFTGRIFYIRLYENDVLVHNFVPVKRNADDKPGILDTETGKFFFNNGSGEFAIGGEVENPCVNVGAGYYAEQSTINLGSVGTRTACPSGTYSNIQNGTSLAACKSCPATKYNDATGMAACKSCPTGFNYNADLGKTSINQCTLHCDNGYYVPANTGTCTQCPQNHYCPGDTYTFNETTDQGKTACDTGLLSPAGSWEQPQCGRIFHVGDLYVYLRATKITRPAFCLDLDKDGNADFFGNMTRTPVPMNKDFENMQSLNKLVIDIKEPFTDSDGYLIPAGEYYVYDDTVTVPQE